MKKIAFSLIFSLFITTTVFTVPTFAEDIPDPTNIVVNK